MYPNSQDPSVSAPQPRPALALSTAAIERALRYIVEGRITLATIQADKKKEGHLITADINPSSGKRAVSSVAFSEELWGADVQDYLITLQGLRKSDMDNIISEARKFSRVTRTHEEEEEPGHHGPKSGRARIPLNYDDDNDDDDNNDNDVVDDEGEADLNESNAAEVTQDMVNDEGDHSMRQDDDDEGFEDNGIQYEGGHAPDDYEDGHAPDDYEMEEEYEMGHGQPMQVCICAH